MDKIDHIAIPVGNLTETVEWYRKTFSCELEYQDDTWAMLRFDNVKLAFVVSHQHPPHIGFLHPHAAEYGPLKLHRDGTRSTYVKDPSGNAVELLAD